MQKSDAIILKPLIEELESYIPLKEKRNTSISSSNVAWQIDHSLKVINLVCETLLKSDSNNYSSKFNKWRILYFTLGRFPRGKVRAPRYVRPPEVISTEGLNSQLHLAYENIEKIRIIQENAHFKHFIFGMLNKPRTVKFLKLHTAHHLKIIREILE